MIGIKSKGDIVKQAKEKVDRIRESTELWLAIKPIQCNKNPWQMEKIPFEDWLRKNDIMYKDTKIISPKKNIVLKDACDAWAGYYLMVKADAQTLNRVKSLLKKYRLRWDEGVKPDELAQKVDRVIEEAGKWREIETKKEKVEKREVKRRIEQIENKKKVREEIKTTNEETGESKTTTENSENESNSENNPQ